jgi:hypothetical protein
MRERKKGFDNCGTRLIVQKTVALFNRPEISKCCGSHKILEKLSPFLQKKMGVGLQPLGKLTALFATSEFSLLNLPVTSSTPPRGVVLTAQD